MCAWHETVLYLHYYNIYTTCVFIDRCVGGPIHNNNDVNKVWMGRTLWPRRVQQHVRSQGVLFAQKTLMNLMSPGTVLGDLWAWTEKGVCVRAPCLSFKRNLFGCIGDLRAQWTNTSARWCTGSMTIL